MRTMQTKLLLVLLPLWSGVALAAEGANPGRMGGMMECGGGMMAMMMGIFVVFGLLLLATLVLAILALVKYLRRS